MATQPEPFTPRRYPVLRGRTTPTNDRGGAPAPRVLAACEVAECCCPDECLVDHDN